MIKHFLINFGVMFGSILAVFLLVAGSAALYSFAIQTFSTTIAPLVMTLVFAMVIASGVVAFIMTLTEYDDDDL